MDEVRSLLLYAEFEIELEYKAMTLYPLTVMVAHSGQWTLHNIMASLDKMSMAMSLN